MTGRRLSVTERIKERDVVGWFQGRMEWMTVGAETGELPPALILGK